MTTREITDSEFLQIQKWLHRSAGIYLSDAKKALVCGRLAKRLNALRCANFSEYFALLQDPKDLTERQTALDLLTTNETYFFREPKHFDFLTDRIVATRVRGKSFSVWSAASSSGEEPYTIAMVLSNLLGEAPWDVLASDISSRVLAKARQAVYPMERARGIPPAFLHRFCLKGTGPHAGEILVARQVRQRVNFLQVNLNEPLPKIGTFDVVFLRNVMIYFDAPTKISVIQRIQSVLKPGGYLFVSHSESLNGTTDALRCVTPSIYQKPVD